MEQGGEKFGQAERLALVRVSLESFDVWIYAASRLRYYLFPRVNRHNLSYTLPGHKNGTRSRTSTLLLVTKLTENIACPFLRGSAGNT